MLQSIVNCKTKLNLMNKCGIFINFISNRIILGFLFIYLFISVSNHCYAHLNIFMKFAQYKLYCIIVLYYFNELGNE